MRVVETYFTQNNRKETNKKRKKDINDEPDHMEMTAVRKAHSWFGDGESENTFKSVYSGGINTDRSVFDRQAVFHVGENEN